ncbi:MAG: hypothetical protein C7B45_14790 [Sulfobacillus acidophilus]|uniref:Cas12f1-like TNB domain-containing protein n=1 Tax=Sulfobacillus acidophilus TaxID=53633 RepID=A0A2T2WE14_9FIRM|nr:MAG: hypothetical protein C7B45_14790 [Sulfobacillus acidophilus]
MPDYRAVADQDFCASFPILKCKAHRYETQIVEANRWSPSSKICSTPGCRYLYQDLTLTVRTWTCPSCGVTHDRAVNAANNLKRLATETALPVATQPVRYATMRETPTSTGKSHLSDTKRHPLVCQRLRSRKKSVFTIDH